MKISAKLLKLGKKEKGAIENALSIIMAAIEGLQQADHLVENYQNVP